MSQVEPNSGSSTIKCLGDLNLDSNSIPDTIPDGELGNVKAAVHESEAANDSGLKELPCNVMKGLRVRSLLKGEGEIQKVYDKGGDYIYGLVFDGTKEEERLSNHDLIAREIVFLRCDNGLHCALPSLHFGCMDAFGVYGRWLSGYGDGCLVLFVSVWAEWCICQDFM